MPTSGLLKSTHSSLPEQHTQPPRIEYEPEPLDEDMFPGDIESFIEFKVI